MNSSATVIFHHCGIQPHVTLMHSDLPQILEDEYEGFLNLRIIEDFTAYADVCFREFGDRVLHWTTFNEANIFVIGGYDNGLTPPGRCSSPFGINCTKGNSVTEPYLAAHNLLLAHASAARLYKENYEAKQHGIVGFNLFCYHFVPLTNITEDIIAAQRSYEFLVGWFMHPLIYGDYPEIMRRNVGIRLPILTENESKLVQGSFDFIGVNYYNVMRTKDNSSSLTIEPRDFSADMATKWIANSSAPLKEYTYPNTPWGLQGVLEHFKQVYGNPPIFIHENGQVANHDMSVNDLFRVEYLQSHIRSLLETMRNGSNAKGYFVWSFMDVYELLFNYNYTFGLYYVDFNDPNLTRLPKLSQNWYSGFLKGGNVTIDGKIDQADHITTIRGLYPRDGGHIAE